MVNEFSVRLLDEVPESGSTVLALVKASTIMVRTPATAGDGVEPFSIMKGRVQTSANQGMAPQFRVAVTRHLTIWGIGETVSSLQPGDTAECLIPWAAVMIVLPSETK